MFKSITRNILVLGLVSFFTDISSEMLYPIMPLFLRSVGFTFVAIGLLEGIAEAVAGLGKIYFGNISDRFNRRREFVILGYGSSALSKVLLVLAQSVPSIFLVRLLDRLGKGIRTAPRDAILAHQSSKNNIGAIFGFHRAMDTLGAFIGPLIALWLLYLLPGQYRTLFTYAAIPAVISVLVTLMVKDVHVKATQTKKQSLLHILSGKEIKTTGFYRLIVPFLLFALVNSSDMFLLLWVKKQGLTDTAVISLYIGYNFIYALASYPAGIAADKYGKKKLLILGYSMFVAVYGCFYFCHTFLQFALIFIVYGFYAACTEGNVKALIGDKLLPAEKGGGLGFLAGWQSVALLLASSWTGLLWNYNFVFASFIISAIAVSGVCAWMIRGRDKAHT